MANTTEEKGFTNFSVAFTPQIDALAKFGLPDEEVDHLLEVARVLHCLCVGHTVKKEHFRGRDISEVITKIVRRSMRMIDLTESHQAGAAEKTRKALEWLRDNRFLQLAEIGGDGERGRPRTVVNLDLEVFENGSTVHGRWVSVLEPLRQRLIYEAQVRSRRELEQTTWIAKVDFVAYPGVFGGVRREFKTGQIVDLESVQFLRGAAGGDAHLQRVEPLNGRVFVKCPCKCERTFPVDPEILKPAKQKELINNAR